MKGNLWAAKEIILRCLVEIVKANEKCLMILFVDHYLQIGSDRVNLFNSQLVLILYVDTSSPAATISVACR